MRPGLLAALLGSVTNAPILIAGWVNSDTPTKVYLLWSQALAAGSPSGITLSGKTVTSAVAAGVEGGSLVVLTTSAPYAYGDTASVSVPAGTVFNLASSPVGNAAVSGLAFENLVGSATPVVADLTNRQTGLNDVSAGVYTAPTGPRFALLPVKIAEGSSGWVELEIASSTNYATCLGLMPTYGIDNTLSQQQISYFALTNGSGNGNRSLNSGTNSFYTTGFTYVVGTDTKMRLRRDAVGKRIVIDSYSTAGGWVERYVFQGYQDCDLYVVVGVVTSGKQLLNPITYGTIPV